MRIVCKDRRSHDLVGNLKKDTAFLNITNGVAPSDAVFTALNKYLSEWSKYLLSDISSPKKN